MAKFEGSPKDVREDKKQAKARGMSMKTWEQSPQDEAHDRASRRKSNLNPPKPLLGRPPAPDYEQSPAKERASRMQTRTDNLAPRPPMGDEETPF